MLEIIFDNWDKFGKILLIFFIFIIINFYLIVTYLREYILNNWNYFKDQAWFIPFSGFVKKNIHENSIESIKHNIISYLWNIAKKILNMLTLPFVNIFEIISVMIGTTGNTLNQLRKQFTAMRGFFRIIILKIYKKIKDIIVAISYSLLKIREGLKKGNALFRMLNWTIVTSYYFMISMLLGPIGMVGKFAETWGVTLAGFTLGIPGIALWYSEMCFDPDTYILLNNYSKKKIKDITLSDVLINNNNVVGILKFDINKEITIYNYNDVFVTGNHFVKENDIFKRVKDSINAKPILYNKNELICLVTSSGIININNIIFKDYLDTHNVNINQDIHKIVELKLNENIQLNFKRSLDLLWGISENTTILSNNKNILAKYLKIGDNIGDNIENNIIKAIIYIDSKYITHYLYKNNNNTYILSGNLLILEENKWIRTSMSKYVTKTYSNDNFIHFITTNNKISLNNLEITDFSETNDIITNEIISDLIDNAI